MNETRFALHNGPVLGLAAHALFDKAAAVAQCRLTVRGPVPAVTRLQS